MVKGLIIILFLTSCANVPKRPKGEVCVIDTSQNICYRLRIPHHEDGEWEYVGDLGLDEIDKYNAFSPEYMIKLTRYIKRLREYAAEKCK